MRFVLIAGALAVAVLAATSSAVAANGCGNGEPMPRLNPLRACVVASALAAGDYATAVASGTVTQPESFSVVLYTSKSQPVDVAWSMVCSRGTSAGSKSGQATLQTFKTGETGPTGHPGAWSIRTIKSFPMANSDSCVVSADAQLSTSGSLRLELLGVRR